MSGSYLAIDIGGTKLAAGVVAHDGRVVVRDRVPTPQREVWPALSRLVLRVMAARPSDLVACGVGCGGPMDPAAGTVSPLHIPSWRNVPLQAMIEELTHLPTFLENDAKALALGEGWCGAAVDTSDYISMVVGTGVGGGIVSGGRLLHGRLGNAGHIGHVVVEPDGRACRCGAHGCLEAYACGPAIEAETGRPPQRAPIAIVERTGLLVGRAIASVAAIVDFQMAVVGGSVALGFSEPFFTAAQEEIERRARISFTSGLVARPAALGGFSPLVGAAAVARAAAVAAQR